MSMTMNFHNVDWLHERIIASQPSKLRMPLLCALAKSLALPIYSEGWNELSKGITMHYHQLESNESYITSMTTSDDSIIALGSGNANGHLYFVKEHRMENDAVSSRFHKLFDTQLDRPIYSLDWTKQNLLVGSNEGTIQLYNTEAVTDQLNSSSHSLKLEGEYQSKHTPTCFVAAPHKRVPNSHVQSVSFNPSYSFNTHTTCNQSNSQEQRDNSLFLGTITNHIELWDANYPGDSSLRTASPDQGAIHTAHWSPLSPHLYVTGGDERHLHVIDVRVQDRQGILWQAHHAHLKSIRDAQFNPFFPYWLASGGEDGIINIWDLRATCHRPLAKIDGHQGAINSVTWGNIRPENLTTTSMDGTVRVWLLSERSMPIWETYDHAAQQYQRGQENPVPEWLRKKEMTHVEENWWSDAVLRSGTVLAAFDDDDDGGVDDNLSTLSLPEVNLSSAFGVGKWGNMNVGSLYSGGVHEKSKGSVVQAVTSKKRPGVFYSTSSFGQLCTLVFRPATRALLDYPHRFEFDKDPLCYEIDKAIYCRQIKLANELITKYKELSGLDEYQQRLRDERLNMFNEALIVPSSITDNEWSFNSIPSQDSKRLWTDTDMWQCAEDIFRKDLTYSRYHLPPGCATSFRGIALDTCDSFQLQLCHDIFEGSGSKGTEEGIDLPSSPSRLGYELTTSHVPSISGRRRSQPYLRRSSTTPNLPSDALHMQATFADDITATAPNEISVATSEQKSKSGIHRSKTVGAFSKWSRQTTPHLSHPSPTETSTNKEVREKTSPSEQQPTEKSNFSFSQLKKASIRESLRRKGKKKQQKNNIISEISSPTLSATDLTTKRGIASRFFSNSSSAVPSTSSISSLSSRSPGGSSIYTSPSPSSSPLIISVTPGKVDDTENNSTNPFENTAGMATSPTLQHQEGRENKLPTPISDTKRHPSSLLAPAKSIKGVFNKSLRRKNTNASSSSSSISSVLSGHDKEPQQYHHRHIPQLDPSPSSSRNAL